MKTFFKWFHGEWDRSWWGALIPVVLIVVACNVVAVPPQPQLSVEKQTIEVVLHEQHEQKTHSQISMEQMLQKGQVPLLVSEQIKGLLQ